MSTVSIESKQLANGDKESEPLVAQMQEVWAKLDCLGESANGTVWFSAKILLSFMGTIMKNLLKMQSTRS